MIFKEIPIYLYIERRLAMLFIGMLICMIVLCLMAFETFGDWFVEPFTRKYKGDNKKGRR